MALEKEAPKAGGRVVSLLGNHEMMNLMGDLRYVSVGNFASFADGESEARRQTALRQYFDWRKAHPTPRGTVSTVVERTAISDSFEINVLPAPAELPQLRFGQFRDRPL